MKIIDRSNESAKVKEVKDQVKQVLESLREQTGFYNGHLARVPNPTVQEIEARLKEIWGEK